MVRHCPKVVGYRTYKDYNALEQAAMQAWRKAALDTKLIKSVCAAPYLNRATSD